MDWRDKSLVVTEYQTGSCCSCLEERVHIHYEDCTGDEEDKLNWTDNFLGKLIRFDTEFVMVKNQNREMVLKLLVFELERMVS